jgi:hypothetical protein
MFYFKLIANNLLNEYVRCYLTWYRFISYEFKIEHKKKTVLNNLYWLSLCNNIGRVYLTKAYVLVLKMPNKINFNQGKLHNETGPAILYNDNPLYYWKGTKVPKKLIMNPGSITKNDLQENTNAEVRRCFIEKLGVTKYFEILSEGKGLNIIDTDIDYQGYPMKLMSFDYEKETIQVLEVTDTSTEIVYNIYPPSQNCKNVWEAKADTFKGEKLSHRQGDVGIIDLNNTYDKPLIET